MIARDPLFYKQTMFRAFLHLTKEEVEEMSIGAMLDYSVMLTHVLKILHAPYLKHDNSL